MNSGRSVVETLLLAAGDCHTLVTSKHAKLWADPAWSWWSVPMAPRNFLDSMWVILWENIVARSPHQSWWLLADPKGAWPCQVTCHYVVLLGHNLEITSALLGQNLVATLLHSRELYSCVNSVQQSNQREGTIGQHSYTMWLSPFRLNWLTKKVTSDPSML